MSTTPTNDFVRITAIPDPSPSRYDGLRAGGIYRVERWTYGCGDRFPRVYAEGDDTYVLAWEKEQEADTDKSPTWELVDLRTLKRVRITAVPAGWDSGTFVVGDVMPVVSWHDDSDNNGLYPFVRDDEARQWCLASLSGYDVARRPSWEPVPDDEELLPVGPPPVVVKPAAAATRPTHVRVTKAPDANYHVTVGKVYAVVSPWCGSGPRVLADDGVIRYLSRADHDDTESMGYPAWEPADAEPEFPDLRKPGLRLFLLGAENPEALMRFVLNKAREGIKRDAVLTCWSIVSLLANALGEPTVVEKKDKSND